MIRMFILAMKSIGTFDVVHEVAPKVPIINQPITGPITQTIEPLPALAEWSILLEVIGIIILMGILAFGIYRQRRSS